ncbi:flagellar biosynthesis anti-sigma factor FlgM [Clostridium sp. A1-XYC3]|uniref:Negative regulator of flagellin synthesis n=1 Tax=Clostridium tanneri TaxID=3037988 RepID=A0ABU4JNM0_9CLOT|nr:flagellar biosynthesis anti-sigma factor FlgM [Clostridium sp. A1-XYC3]MDW8799707.1 flagellar biosynthesis anti-sigma factor FlgM [Clostridium sp. A1-XYC3]
MKINGVSPNNIVGLYSNNKMAVEKKMELSQKDSIQISSVAKSLSSYSIDDKFVTSKEKIERLKSEISNGTYNRDSKLVAAKILEEMKRI